MAKTLIKRLFSAFSFGGGSMHKHNHLSYSKVSSHSAAKEALMVIGGDCVHLNWHTNVLRHKQTRRALWLEQIWPPWYVSKHLENDYFTKRHNKYLQKSRIWETLNLSMHADSSTDTKRRRKKRRKKVSRVMCHFNEMPDKIIKAY